MKGDTELLIITGMSGAGRSTVAHSLEDLGWYVVGVAFVVDDDCVVVVCVVCEIGRAHV